MFNADIEGKLNRISRAVNRTAAANVQCAIGASLRRSLSLGEQDSRHAPQLLWSERAEIEMRVKLVLSLVLAGLIVLFVVQNVTLVEVRFLFWAISMSLSLFVFLLFVAGVIVGWLLHSYYRHANVQKHGVGAPW